MTARDEIGAVAQLYDWQALSSPQLGEMIYRRGAVVVFAQFDRADHLRGAQLRKVIAPRLTTELEAIGWSDRTPVHRCTRVCRWFSEFGESAAEARAQRRRRR